MNVFLEIIEASLLKIVIRDFFFFLDMTLMKRLRRSPSLDYDSLELMRSASLVTESLRVFGRSTKHAGSKEIMPKAKLGKIKEFLTKKKALSIGAWKYNNPPEGNYVRTTNRPTNQQRTLGVMSYKKLHFQ